MEVPRKQDSCRAAEEGEIYAWLVLHIQDDSPSIVEGKKDLQEEMQKGGEVNAWIPQWNRK